MKELTMFISWGTTLTGAKIGHVAHVLKGNPEDSDVSFCGRKTVSIALFRGMPMLKKGENVYDQDTYWFDKVQICPVCIERIRNKSGGQLKRE
jgi:hypothetical protein